MRINTRIINIEKIANIINLRKSAAANYVQDCLSHVNLNKDTTIDAFEHAGKRVGKPIVGKLKDKEIIALSYSEGLKKTLYVQRDAKGGLKTIEEYQYKSNPLGAFTESDLRTNYIRKSFNPETGEMISKKTREGLKLYSQEDFANNTKCNLDYVIHDENTNLYHPVIKGKTSKDVEFGITPDIKESQVEPTAKGCFFYPENSSVSKAFVNYKYNNETSMLNLKPKNEYVIFKNNTKAYLTEFDNNNMPQRIHLMDEKGSITNTLGTKEQVKNWINANNIDTTNINKLVFDTRYDY